MATQQGHASRVTAGRARRARRLRHLDLDLGEPVDGICGTNPRRIRQICLADDGIDAHLDVGVKVGRRFLSTILSDKKASLGFRCPKLILKASVGCLTQRRGEAENAESVTIIKWN